MTRAEIEIALGEELAKIAPDVPLDDVEKNGDLREEFDIDSMDFLRLITALGNRFDRSMPEADYPKMSSFSDLAGYLDAKSS